MGSSNTTQQETANITEAPGITMTYQPPATTSVPAGDSSSEEDSDGCLSVSRRPYSREIIAAAIQKLGVQLLQNLETTPEQPNIIISPLSISLGLSQLALGAHVLLICFPTSCLISAGRYIYMQLYASDELCQQLPLLLLLSGERHISHSVIAALFSFSFFKQVLRTRRRSC